ncbi:MAG: stage II sporulation protein M [Dethiobacter sp.]|nr:stage II sporulation protein M [Dethiobacter sp.]
MWQRFQEAIAEHVREQFSIYLLVTMVFTAGIAAGALSVRFLEEIQVRELNDFFFGFVDYLSERQPINQGLIMQRALLQNGIFVLALWVLGNLFFGIIPVLGILFYRGFTIGFSVGFLAEQNSLRGVLFAIGAILPQNLIYVPMTILSSVCAVIFSLILLRRRFAGKVIPYGSYLFQYSLLMLIVAALFALGSIVEAIITPVFMRAVVTVL